MDDLDLTQLVVETFEKDLEFFKTTREEMYDTVINITGYGGFTCEKLEQQILLGEFGKNTSYVIEAYKEELAEKCAWARREVFNVVEEIRAQHEYDCYFG